MPRLSITLLAILAPGVIACGNTGAAPAAAPAGEPAAPEVTAPVAAPDVAAPDVAAPAAIAPVDDCTGRSAVLAISGRSESRIELVCDAGTHRVRFTSDEDTDGQVVERALSMAEGREAWRRIDATGWRTLATTCGVADDELRWARERRIELVVEGTVRTIACEELEVSAAHEALMAAIEELAEPLRAPPTAAAPPVIGRGHVGGIRLGMPLAELFELPGITVPGVAGPHEVGDQYAHVEVWIDGVLAVEVAAEHRVVRHILVVGAGPRVPDPSGAAGVGIGSTAADLQRSLGAPVTFAQEEQGSPSFAEFAAADGIHFYFEFEGRWPRAVAKGARVSGIRLIP